MLRGSGHQRASSASGAIMSVRRRRLSACALWGFTVAVVSCEINPIGPAPQPPGPIHNHSGDYTLTITAGDGAGQCAPSFPQTVKRRLYAARIQQRSIRPNVYQLEVYLSGADFIPASGGLGGVFTGTLSLAGDIRFSLFEASPGDPDPWWPFGHETSVAERLSDGTQLVVVGEITARGTAGVISGKGGTLNHSSGGRCAIERFEMVLSEARADSNY